MSTLRSMQLAIDLDKFFDDVDNQRNNEQSSRDVDGKFHPSALGDCRRKLYYAYNKTPPKHNIPVRLRRTFDHGSAVHSWVQDKLVKVFSDTDIRQYAQIEIEKSINKTEWASLHNLAGSADALITFTSDYNDIKGGEKVIYELKTSSSSTWDSLRSPMTKHVMQANCYAACLGADYILFDYYNKDKDVHKRFMVNASKDVQVEISDMLLVAMLSCVGGEEIPREANSWSCSSCQYKYTCNPEI
jgi:CRISPR/Cas system-associated exonuclease Cas4 (RecB family)